MPSSSPAQTRSAAPLLIKPAAVAPLPHVKRSEAAPTLSCRPVCHRCRTVTTSKEVSNRSHRRTSETTPRDVVLTRRHCSGHCLRLSFAIAWKESWRLYSHRHPNRFEHALAILACRQDAGSIKITNATREIWLANKYNVYGNTLALKMLCTVPTWQKATMSSRHSNNVLSVLVANLGMCVDHTVSFYTESNAKQNRTE